MAGAYMKKWSACLILFFAFVGCRPFDTEVFLSSHEGEIAKVLVCQPQQRFGSNGCEMVDGAEPRDYCNSGDMDFNLFLEELNHSFSSVTLVKEIVGRRKERDFLGKSLFEKCCRSSISECDCLGEVQQKLTRWPQDIFFAQSNNEASFLRSIHQGNSKDETIYDLLTYRVGQSCGVNWNRASSLEFQGGNMAVNSSFLFLGRDILINYANTDAEHYEERLAAIGLPPKATDSAVTNAIEEVCERSVIWVGTERSFGWLWHTADNYRSNQPIYHIDLFFSLLKWGGAHPSHRGDTLYYLLGVPKRSAVLINFFGQDTDSLKMKQAFARADSLADWIRQTADGVDEQLKRNGVIGKRVEVPLPLRFRADWSRPAVERFWAYCNGLVEERDGDVIYYMPDYVCQSDNTILQTSFTESKKCIERHAIVKTVKGVYEVNAALHCSVLVVDRN